MTNLKLIVWSIGQSISMELGAETFSSTHSLVWGIYFSYHTILSPKSSNHWFHFTRSKVTRIFLSFTKKWYSARFISPLHSPSGNGLQTYHTFIKANRRSLRPQANSPTNNWPRLKLTSLTPWQLLSQYLKLNHKSLTISCFASSV